MINIRMQNKEVQKLSPKITVVGVGGAGGNAVNNMISSGLEGCEFVVCNTDAQALDGSLCQNKIQLGVTVTGGLGAGAKPEIGRLAAEESLDDVLQYLEGANMVFITAGMGGGTGTGAAPVIAKAARDKGILTVGVVTKPFHFEGSTRMRMAEAGIEQMQSFVDTLIVIPNQNLFRVANEKTTFAEAFKMADSVLQSGVRGVTDLMLMPGQINLDFADIRSAMLEMGKAMMGTGEAEGERRALEAAEKAINNPLLDDVSMKGARGVIINVTGSYDMSLFEIDEACNRIRDEVDPNANIIFGSTFDETLGGIMRVSIVATGIDVAEMKQRRPVAGNALINAVTSQQQERKLERATPKTEETSWQTAAPVTAPAATVSAPAPQQQSQPQTQGGTAQQQQSAAVTSSAYTMPPRYSAPAAGPRTAAQAVAATATATAAVRKEDPELDMFEQQEFLAQQPVETPAETAPAQSSMRGTVYNDAFIPPQPVDPGVAGTNYSGPQFATGLAASRPADMPAQPATSSGLTLRPPVPGAAAQQQQRKKSPSLFERIAGPLRHHGEQGRGDEDTGSAEGSAAGGGLRASQRPVQQGSLAIDAPVAAKADAHADDELDIPAFLRRQAN
jgi:cell division protein FtsZ